MGAFGIYVHIPYCLQICTYCDFVKFEKSALPPTNRYVELLREELFHRAPVIHKTLRSPTVQSLYFGGGTPSLLSPQEILSIIQAIEKAGFPLSDDAEITLEINPGTIDEASVAKLLEIGINRFSVGAQTFDESFLALTGRRHTVAETKDSLTLLHRRNLNFSFDLLFGLPGQRLEHVRRDVRHALDYEPSHLSAYCLTLPALHPLNRGRAPEAEQAEMFDAIADELKRGGLARYEVSNFAVPGFESRHNLLYWSDRPYWGIGIGAHSYLPAGPWGVRFWNPPSIRPWERELNFVAPTGRQTQLGPLDFLAAFEPSRVEFLKLHQSLTDFGHTALRSSRGLRIADLSAKFDRAVPHIVDEFHSRTFPHVERGLLEKNEVGWALTSRGQALADRVFESLTFLEDEV